MGSPLFDLAKLNGDISLSAFDLVIVEFRIEVVWAGSLIAETRIGVR